jgi:hypothetical protein
MKIPFAFLIRVLTSSSAPPSAVTSLPEYVKRSTLSVSSLFTCNFLLTPEFIHNSFGFLVNF